MGCWRLAWATLLVTCALALPAQDVPSHLDSHFNDTANVQVDFSIEEATKAITSLLFSPQNATTNNTLVATNVTFPFSTTFILNLNRSHDRWEHQAKTLSSLHWPFMRFDAVDGAKMYGEDVVNASELASHDIHSPKRLTAAERGNFLSYHNIFQHIVEHNLSNALIMEDDAEFDDPDNATPEKLSSYMQQLNQYDPNWDVVWLSWYSVHDLSLLQSVFPTIPELFSDKVDPKVMEDQDIGLPNIVKTGPSFGLWCFGISQAGAKKLLNFFAAQRAETDVQFARLNMAYPRSFEDPCTGETIDLPEMKMYGIHPQIVKKHTSLDMLNVFGSSTIGASRFYVHHLENEACTKMKHK